MTRDSYMVEKKKKDGLNLAQYGSIVFTVGLVVAIIAGFFNMSSTATKVVIATLVLVGIFVGALNVTGGESVPFLVATLSVTLLAGLFLDLVSKNFYSSLSLGRIYYNMIALIVPGAIVVAFKAIYETAKDE